MQAVCFTLVEQIQAGSDLAVDYPENVYANKGMGLALHRLGDSDGGIRYLQKAVALASEDDTDPYHYLAAVYIETGQRDKAEALLEKVNPPPLA